MNRFRVYRASAGSGKTFTLVKEYLTLALATAEPGAYRHILAITFTNKAAAEMRERILSTLAGLSDASTQSKAWDIGRGLMAELNISVTELSIRAKATHTHMLHHYNDVAVGTIDSFTHRVVRTFARDLGLNPGFEILLEQDELVAETIDRLYQLVGTEPEVTDALVDLVDEQMDDGKTTDLTTKLTELSKALFNEQSRLHLSRMDSLTMTDFADVRKKLWGKRKHVEQQLQAEAANTLRHLQARGFDASHFAGGKNNPIGRFGSWANGVLQPLTDTQQEKYTTPENWFKKGGVDDFELGQMLSNTANYGINSLALINTLAELINSLFGLALLHKLRQLSREITDEQGKLHISELNHLIAEVVATEPAPFIYERLGARYQHFMIDEFQDTSVLQWLNLMPLVHEGLSRGGISLVVGDGKQAIYRWRSGEVEQFNTLPKAFLGESVGIMAQKVAGFDQLLHERSAALEQNNAPIAPLIQNWRSLPTVVNFNNEVFNALQPLLQGSLFSIYDQSAQLPAKSEGGYVRVDFLEKKKQGGRAKSTENEGDEADESSSESYNTHTNALVLSAVTEALADGYQPSDIALIVRKNDHAYELANLLKANGHEVLSDEALLLSNSMAVQKLLAVLQHLHTPNNPINNAWLLQWLGPTPSTDISTLGFLGIAHEQRATQLIDSLLAPLTRAELSRLDLFSQFERIRLAVAPSPDAYCDAFLSLALQHSGSLKGDRAGFLEFWSQKGSAASLSQQGGNAVRVLSVHKSKGLEFPVVIHPYCDYGPDLARSYVWDDMQIAEGEPIPSVRIKPKKALAEGPHALAIERETDRQWLDNLNLMYVAFTRAAERLYVCAGANPTKNKGNVAHVGEHLWKHLESSVTTTADGWFFETGTKHGPTHQTPKAKDAAVTIKPITALPWESRLQIRKHRGLDVSVDLVWQKRLYGVAMHAALEKLTNAQSIDDVVSMILVDGVIDADQMPETKARLHRLVAHNDLSRFFISHKNTRIEAEIITAQGQIVRPDRIWVESGTAQVLDYKTGMAKPQHRQQVQGYLQALNQLGLKANVGWIYYLETEEVVKVEWD